MTDTLPSDFADDLLLAIDCGNRSVRALLFDLRGELVAKSQVALEDEAAPHPGWMERDADGFWAATAEACRGLWDGHPERRVAVRGVALTTRPGTLVPVDKRGRTPLPAVLGSDSRRASTARLPPLHPLWRAAFRLTGATRAVRHFQREAVVNWWAEYEAVHWAKVHKVLPLSGFLNWKLTGRFADSAGAQAGGLPFDVKTQAWARDLDWKWQALRVARDQLPELEPVGAVLGKIGNAAATATGIPLGVPVVAAASDRACELLGSGCVEPHQGGLSYGSTVAIGVCTRRHLAARRFVPPYPAALPGHFASEMQVFRGDWMSRWFDERERLDELVAAIPPGSHGLVLQPHGPGHPGSQAHGALIGLSDEHTRGHVCRAVLEGLAYALREGRERIERRTRTKLAELRVSGDGAQSDTAMQLTADVFRLPASRPHTRETAGLGAAMDCAVGLGLHRDFGAAVREMTRAGRSFEPDRQDADLYDRLYGEVYRRMPGRLAPLQDRLRAITGPAGRR